MANLNLKPGQYFYRRHRGRWAIWKVIKTFADGGSTNDLVMYFQTKEQAERYVYEMNNWFNHKNKET